MKIIFAILASLFFSLASARTTLSGDVVYNVPGDFPTPQLAWNAIQGGLDLACHRVTVKIAPGSYSQLVAVGALVGACTLDAVTFSGNVDHPDQVVFTGVSANAITAVSGAWLKLEGILASAINATSPDMGRGLVVYQGARVQLGTMAWHVCEWSHIQVSESGELHAEHTSQYLTGTTQAFAIVENGGKLWLNGTWITNLVGQNFPLGMFHVTQLGYTDLSGTILNDIAPLAGALGDIKSGSLLILLGINRRGLDAPRLESTAILIP